jgi:hypothetical protein
LRCLSDSRLSDEFRFNPGDEPAAFYDWLGEHVGFRMLHPSKCRTSPILWRDNQEVHIITVSPMSYGKSTRPYYIRRNLMIHMEGEPWVSGEAPSPSTFDRDQIWGQISERRTLPNITHFRVIQDDLYITALSKWPPWPIALPLQRCPVTFEIELPRGERYHKW